MGVIRVFGPLVVAGALALPQSAAALYLQPGGRFAVGDQPAALAVGDVNGDGHPDIVTVNQESQAGSTADNDASLLLGRGNGTFAAAQSVPLTNGSDPRAAGFVPREVVIADVDGNGKPDMVLTGLSSNGSYYVGVVRNLGGGSFGPLQLSATNTPELAGLAVGNVNGDSHLDVVVGDGFGTDELMLGSGDGTFQAPTDILMGGYNEGTALVDLNGDHKLDVLSTNAQNGTVTVRLGDGAGTFGPPISSPAGGDGSAIAVGDLNGDHIPDVVIAFDGRGAGALLGKGDGTFKAPVTFLPNSGGGDVQLADLNGDGRLDAALASPDDEQVFAVPGNGDGTFGVPVGSGVIEGSVKRLAVGDFTASGRPDLATLSYDSTTSPGHYDVLLIGTAQLPPALATGDVTGVTGHGATLHGTVNPRGQAATTWFEWGTSTAYGHRTTSRSIPAGGSPVDVSAVLAGLPTDRVFHYRLVAQGSGQPLAAGADAVFGTPPPPPPSPGKAPRVTVQRIVLLQHSVAQRTLKVKVGCATACTLAASQLMVWESTQKPTQDFFFDTSHAVESDYDLTGKGVRVPAHQTRTLRVAIPAAARAELAGALEHGGAVNLQVWLSSGVYENVGLAQAELIERARSRRAADGAGQASDRRTTRQAGGSTVYPVDPPISPNGGFGERRGVRYTIHIHGSQVTTWKIDRQDIDEKGCVSYTRGAGTQIITWNSRDGLGVVAPDALHGDEVMTTLDGSRPVDILAHFSIDRSGHVHSGEESQGRQCYVASGGGGGSPPTDCGHREQSGNIGFELNTGEADMWRDLWDDKHVGADTYKTCPFYGMFVPLGGANDLRLYPGRYIGVPKILVRHPPKVISFTTSRREVTHPDGSDVVSEITWKVVLTRAR